MRDFKNREPHLPLVVHGDLREHHGELGHRVDVAALTPGNWLPPVPPSGSEPLRHEEDEQAGDA
jgi:hypothetical protein